MSIQHGDVERCNGQVNVCKWAVNPEDADYHRIVVGIGIHPTAVVVVAGTARVTGGYVVGIAVAPSTPCGSL
eukprot:8207787-Ditylum_brightwellii.AAC.1